MNSLEEEGQPRVSGAQQVRGVEFCCLMQCLAEPVPYQSSVPSRLWDPTFLQGRQGQAGRHPSRKLLSSGGPLWRRGEAWPERPPRGEEGRKFGA